MELASVEDLLAQAAELVEQYEFQAAVNKFYEAHQLEPDNTTVLDNLSDVLLELGLVEDAQHISLKAIQPRFLFFSIFSIPSN